MTATVSQSLKTTSGKLAHDWWVRSDVHSGSERLLEQQLSDLVFTFFYRCAHTSEHSQLQSCIVATLYINNTLKTYR